MPIYVWTHGRRISESVTDAKGHEHGSDGEFVSKGGGGDEATPADHAKAIQNIGDDAIASMQALKRSISNQSMKKQRNQMLPEHDKHEAAVNKHFDELDKVIKNDAEANQIAKEMGYQSVSGSKGKVLKTLRMKTLDRLGSFIRPYA